MKEQDKITAVFRFIKLFFACCLGIVFLIFCAIFLRHICIKTTHASESEYIYMSSATTLHETNTLENPILTIPKGYYAELLSKTGNLARVKYNSVSGFIELNESHTLTISPPENYFQSAEIKTKADAGTYLRESPSTTSREIAIVPPNTNLNFIGEISGTRPTDGTSESWFLVHYYLSDTMVHTGYIYSERVIITYTTAPPSGITTPSSTPTTPLSTSESNTSSKSILNEPISAGVKIFLCILFSTLGIIIFALLIISPHEKKDPSKRPRVHGQKTDNLSENTTKNSQFNEKNSEKPINSTSFTPKTAIFGRNLQKNAPTGQNLGTKQPKNHENNGFSTQKIPAQTAREANFPINSSRNNTRTNSHMNSSKINKNSPNAEYGVLHEFPLKENHHQVISSSIPSHSNRLSKKKELVLMGEKNGKMPNALSRYFDIE